MLLLIFTIVILAIIFWAICELVSAIAGIFFMCIAAVILLKLAKGIIK
jgi:hypothetical protein